MDGRRRLVAIVLLATVLHTVGIARTILPAQDGLKFIRIARQFQTTAAFDVIRRSDQHPLYPALIALAEPVVACFAGHGPDTWRIAAQAVAALAAIAAIVPLYGLARALFNDRIAALAALLYVVFPLPLEVGHDTLSDSLGLLALLTVLRLGVTALQTGRPAALASCGLVAGLGYLARPEVALAPLAVALTLAVRGVRPELRRRAALELSAVSVAFLTLVGGYALVKGEVSSKLALRYGAGIAPKRAQAPARKAPRWLPPGLDDPRWDFSPKEEPAPRGTSATSAIQELIVRWAEGLGGFFGFFAIWGAVRARAVRGRLACDSASDANPPPEPTHDLRLLLTIYLALDALVLVRHVGLLGYLSDRHLLPLVAVSLPWAAAGTWICTRGLGERLRWTPLRARRVGVALVVLALAVAIAVPQWKPGHRSRFGHWAAGGWLKEHAQPSEAVLDTRGWAAFVSNLPSYDYWHVRQALTDAHLSYVVVGVDELMAPSRRGATLRAVLAYAAEPVASFADDQYGEGLGVQVYRFHHPDSWEGLRP